MTLIDLRLPNQIKVRDIKIKCDILEQPLKKDMTWSPLVRRGFSSHLGSWTHVTNYYSRVTE